MRLLFRLVFFMGLLVGAFAYGVVTGAYQVFPFNHIVAAKDLARDTILGPQSLPPKGAEKEAPGLSPRIAAYADQFDLLPTQTADVVFLGDSLVQGGAFTERFPGQSVVNRGIGGDTTTGVLLRLDNVIRLRPRKVFLMVGINDIASGYAPEVTVENLRRILGKLDAAGIQVFAQSVLYTNQGKIKRDVWKKLRSTEVDVLNNHLKSMAVEFPHVSFVDLNAALSQGGALSANFTYDGLHLTGRGYDAWWRAIEPLVTS